MSDWTQSILIIWSAAFLLLIPWSAFNKKEVTVGDLVLGILFAPMCLIICYADWNAVVIRWPTRKERP